MARLTSIVLAWCLTFVSPASAGGGGGRAVTRNQVRASGAGFSVGGVPQVARLTASLETSPGVFIAAPSPSPQALPVVAALAGVAPAQAMRDTSGVITAGPDAAADAPAAPAFKRGLVSSPLVRGDIGWKEAWALVNPDSRLNRVGYLPRGFPRNKTDALKEAEMWAQNLAYVLGRAPETWVELDSRRSREARAARVAELSGKVRAAYRLPPLDGLRLPVARLGAKVGTGSQGQAFLNADRPGRVIKTYDWATPGQIQEMAAILNTLADAGQPVERMSLVRLEDGRLGLEMRHFSAQEGWIFVDQMTRRDNALNRRVEARADDALRALSLETLRVMGIDAADWRRGLDGSIDGSYLGNFAYNTRTGELTAFDPLAVW